MRKALLPMIASLALCGTATAALIATNARAAQSGAHNPVMVAMETPSETSPTAAPAAEGGAPSGMMRRGAAMAGARRAQFCKLIYARKAGQLAFQEARLSLTSAQTPLFERWKAASLDIAKQHQNDCASRERPRTAQRPTVLDRMTREETQLKKRLADLDAVRPALTAFYDSLTPAQRAEFGTGGRHGMRGRMRHRMMMGMMGGPRAPETGRGRMAPMGEPPAPPPAR